MNSLNNHDPCLVLLCKRPALGHSKQRLAEGVGKERALDIAQLLLDCAVEDLLVFPGLRALAPDQAQHLQWGQALCESALCIPQSEGNLGERLNALDMQLRNLGHQYLIYIGSDCPLLGPDDYQRVSEQLQHSDTVLLMAQDGGVVLMASRKPWPTLNALPWSTQHLGQALAECCRRSGHSVSLAGELFDIDLQEDLKPLLEALADDARPARLKLKNALADSLEISDAK